MENKYHIAQAERPYYSTKNVVMREIGANKTVLDVGCNTGYFARIDTDRNNKYYGLDYQQAAIDLAKPHYVDALCYDLNTLKDLPWKNTQFDVILFPDVLEHVLHPEHVLAHFSTYLKPNGHIIISLPNIANWQVRFKLLFGRFNYTDTGILDRTHLHFYTFENVEELATNSKLKTEKKLFSASFFGPLINACKLLKGLLSADVVLICKRA